VVEHLPGVQNTVADALSRWPMDRSDWSLNPEVFQLVEHRWGPHTIDWFATRQNTRLPRFASWAADEQATYVDALQNLGKPENGYANPPFSLIGKILQKIRKTGRDLTLIVPAWPSQHWWPLLLELLSDTPLILPQVPDLFSPPERVGALPSAGPGLGSFRMQDIGQVLQAQGISQEVIQTLCHRWAVSTHKNYDAIWRRWRAFCRDKNCDFFDPPTSFVLAFLSQEFQKFGTASAVNHAISSLSGAAQLVCQRSLAEHPLVKSYRQAVNALRPPAPSSTRLGILLSFSNI
jgi:hypothetical protein